MLLKFETIFERPKVSPKLTLLPIDEEILRHVRRHRFLTAKHLMRVISTSPQTVFLRLSSLFRHGYLNRPKSQWKYDQVLRNIDVVYSLGKRGVRHLQSLGEIESHRIHEKKVGHVHLDHTLEVADFMTRLESELPTGVKLEYLDNANSQRSVATYEWSVPIHYKGEQIKIGVIPDRVFRLSTKDEELLFCLEVDRGTMPVMRSNPAQSSFYRKLLAYHATWRSGVHLNRLKWRRFRVLTVTSSRERRNHIIEACKEVVVSGGSGLFMFADQENLDSTDDLSRMPWIIGDGVNITKIISETRG